MADLNLRNISPELRTALKTEAAAAGKGLIEYSIEILANRKPASLLPPASNPGPGDGLMDAFHAARDPQSGKVLKQPEPKVVYGMWGEDEATKTAGPVLVESGPGVVVASKPTCPHGYMNRALCPQCRAGQ